MNKSNKLFAMLAGMVIYGFSITVAHALPIVGSTSAIFSDPVGPGRMQTTGAGTSSFTWGNGRPYRSAPSSLSFTGAAFNTNTESYFDIGRITYFNGTIRAGTQARAVDFGITLNFITPGGIDATFNYMLSLINTRNTRNRVASADIVSFPTGLPTESFALGGVTYTVGLEVGFVNDRGGFSNRSTFSVYEGRSATATLRGIVTASNTTGKVPEPSILALLGIGLLGMAFSRKRFNS